MVIIYSAYNKAIIQGKNRRIKNIKNEINERSRLRPRFKAIYSLIFYGNFMPLVASMLKALILVLGFIFFGDRRIILL